jgi:ATP-binding cassette subfamily F protein uup
VVDTIFAFETGGEIRQYPGNYSIYLDYQKNIAELGEKKSEAKSAKVSTAKSNSAKKFSFKEKKEYEELERKIPEMESHKESIEQLLYTNPPTDFEEMSRLTEELSKLTQSIDTATDRWMELAEKMG